MGRSRRTRRARKSKYIRNTLPSDFDRGSGPFLMRSRIPLPDGKYPWISSKTIPIDRRGKGMPCSKTLPISRADSSPPKPPGSSAALLTHESKSSSPIRKPHLTTVIVPPPPEPIMPFAPVRRKHAPDSPTLALTVEPNGDCGASVRTTDLSRMPSENSCATAAQRNLIEKHDERGRRFVESVVQGDGSEDLAGRKIHRGIVYASAQVVCGRENLDSSEWDNEIFSGSLPAGWNFRTYYVGNSSEPGSPCIIPEKSNTRNGTSVPRKNIVARGVHQFLRKNTGVAVILHQVSARGPSPELRSLYADRLPSIYATTKTHSCVPASILNIVYALKGRKGADTARAILDTSNERYMNHKSLGLAVNKISCKGMRLEVRRMKKWEQEIIHSSERMVAFEWLASRHTGVWIVRLKQDGFVDHAISIDSTKSTKVIVDSEEEMPVLLSREALLLCGGANASRLRISEVRELVCIK